MDKYPLDILYLDDDVVAIRKPAGLLVHRSRIARHDTRYALQLVRDQLGRRVYPVHRLDRPTAGVLVFALARDTARSLSEEFAGQRVTKTYLAIVRGYTEEQGIINYPLHEERDLMTDRRVRSDKGPQAAVTAFRRLAHVELPHPVGRYPSTRYSLVEVHPRTGRRHQIRRHMKHIFHPVIGDTKYGEGRHNRFFRTHHGSHRLLLSATEISFVHPVTDRPITIHAPVDTPYARVMHRLGWRGAVPIRWLPPP